MAAPATRLLAVPVRPVLRALVAAALLLAGAAPAPAGDTGNGAGPPAEDLPEIRFQRRLRVLVPADDAALRAALEGRARSPEVELLRRFAEEQLLEIEWLTVESWPELERRLLSGAGDVAAAGLTVTAPRKRHIAFTLPVHARREVLTVRAGDRIGGPADLVGREVVVRERSSFWDLLQRLRRAYPGIGVRLVPEETRDAALLAAAAEGRYDMVAVDEQAFAAERGRWPELKTVPGFAAGDTLAWGVRPDAPLLLAALNRFLQREQLARPVQTVHKDDLPGIRERGVLRVLTRNNATTYYLWRGRQVGFEYELMKRFAESQGLTLEMIVAPSRQHLIPMLLWGAGDVIAAGLTATEERRRLGVAFSRPYNWVREVLVARRDDRSLHRLADLAGRTIVVRRSSSYWKTASGLTRLGIDVLVRPAPEDMETEEIIAEVAAGKFDLTIADSHILGVELAWRDDIRGVFDLRGPVAHGWAVRAADRELLAALDAFLEREYRGVFYNVLYARYFEDPRRIRRQRSEQANGGGALPLSPYDEMVRRHAARHEIDWRLVVAQMYQESRFDPKARSIADAQGLLQVLPSTAARFGIDDLADPEQGLEAGIRYLAWLHGRFSPELPVKDRMWFALAAYNAGYDHVQDARALARELGLDPNRWFGNVERTMRLLSRRKYYRKARAGYVRGGQTVIYVREIRDRYRAYVRLTEPRPAS